MPFKSAENRKENDAIIMCNCCKKNIPIIEHYLFCDSCSKTFRPKCLGLTGININRAAANDTWQCKDCKPNTPTNSKRKIIQNNDEENLSKRPNNRSSPNEKMDEILKAINNLNNQYEDIKNITSEIQSDQKTICQQLSDLNMKIENVSKINEGLKKDVVSLRKIQTEQSEIINKLESDIDLYHQSFLSANLIIGGLPKNTDGQEAVEKILTTLKTTCTMEDVKETIFLKSQNDTANVNKNAPLLLIKFKNNEAKMEVKQKKKQKKNTICK